MPNIRHSIQDYCRKINSRLTGFDILSLFVTVFFILALVLVIQYQRLGKIEKVVYKEAEIGSNTSLVTEDVMHTDGRPFGSNKGKTYTFSWCSGSKNISAKNKIYFSSQADAEKSGRTLSKLCRK